MPASVLHFAGPVLHCARLCTAMLTAPAAVHPVLLDCAGPVLHFAGSVLHCVGLCTASPTAPAAVHPPSCVAVRDDHLVVGGGGKPAAVLVEGHGPDLVRVVRQRLHTGPGPQVPQLDLGV